jgi:ribosomal protein S18 acetylase RimI-like enzyme
VRPISRIVDIALLPEQRGKGIGTALLRDLLAEADGTGKRVTIHVERLNPALRLYERLGFRVAEEGVYLFLERPPATCKRPRNGRPRSGPERFRGAPSRSCSSA